MKIIRYKRSKPGMWRMYNVIGIYENAVSKLNDYELTQLTTMLIENGYISKQGLNIGENKAAVVQAQLELV